MYTAMVGDSSPHPASPKGRRVSIASAQGTVKTKKDREREKRHKKKASHVHINVDEGDEFEEERSHSRSQSPSKLAQARNGPSISNPRNGQNISIDLKVKSSVYIPTEDGIIKARTA